jgi:transcriptional regulator with XRE-family HTH domain
MAVRQRLGDLGATDARRLVAAAGREIRAARRTLGISQRASARRAGVSPSQFGRIERGEIRHPTLDQLCRAGRSVGLDPSFRYFAAAAPVQDAAQLAILARFESLLASPLRLRREVPLPIAGDQRAWDGRVAGDGAGASIEAESRLEDVQAVARRIELKARDDPGSGVVLLVLNRTAHNRRVLAEHREALRAQFPLDGAAIARALRSGHLPAASGIILL